VGYNIKKEKKYILSQKRHSQLDAQAGLPPGLMIHFQEYDLSQLDLNDCADLVIQRTLEFGTWEETRWLFLIYGAERIHVFLRQRG